MIVACSPGLKTALFGLVLAGFGRSAFFVLFTYPTEIVGCHLRTTASVFIFMASGTGTFFGCFLAMLTIPRSPQCWRIYLGILSILHLFGFLLLFLVAETPRYLLVSGKPAEALKVIQSFNPAENKNVVLKPATAEKRGSFADLCRNPECSKNVFIITLVSVFVAIISVGTILLFLESLQNDRAHSDCILVSSLEFEKNCKLLTADDYWLQCLSSTSMILAAVLAKTIADSFGRRKLLLTDGYIAILLTSLFLFCKPKSIQTILAFNTRISLNIARVVLALYANEIFPTSIRGVALGISMAGAESGAAIAPLIAQYLAKENHPAAVSCFMASAILWVVLMHSIQRETMDVSQADLVTEERKTKEEIAN